MTFEILISLTCKEKWLFKSKIKLGKEKEPTIKYTSMILSQVVLLNPVAIFTTL